MVRTYLIDAKRVLGVLVLLACFLAIAAAFTERAQAASPSASADARITFRIGLIEEPDGLNWFVAYSNASYQIWPLTYDFLLNYGKGSKPVPGLATEIPTEENGGITEGGRVWTYHLREGVKWHDGRPLTAEDVAFTFNMTLEQAPSRLQYVERVEVVDDTTVRIICSRPKADLLRLYVPILPKHIWEPLGKKASTTFGNEPPIVGTGPFKIVEWKHGTFLRLERNPAYWGKQPHIDEIIMVVYQNTNTMVDDLKLGAIDAAIGMDANQFRQLESEPAITTWGSVYYNWDYLNYNCNTSDASLGNPVLLDWRFRNALNYAIDRENLCQIAYNGLAEPAATIIPPGQWSDPDFHWQPPAEEAYAFDPAKADALLTEAGYEKDADGNRLDKNDKPIKLRLWATSNQPIAQTEGKLLTGWLTDLGLDIEFATLEAGAFNAQVWNFKGDTYAPDFDMYVNNWMGSVDPNITLSFFTTSGIGVFNESSWSNQEYDRLSDTALQTIDADTRKPILDQLQRIMHTESPWSVLTHFQYLQAFNHEKWTGWPEANTGHDAPFATYAIDDYLSIRPAEAGGEANSDSSSTLVIAVVAVVAVVIAALVFILVRRKGQATEV